ncbi:DUF6989 domain-containing protein [Leptospira ilyithenensis]|uniref:DUF6989 domain-containing protein n=1 Tax=Leptospira ilyithenensis TaxID=2484901 RepID=A0A4R9LSD4_9LEPT|nr:hypothetical protein [Leptospira ilyithenensis]TGN10253.1 hypothetical protein EHS11_10245 [Leptospira ilyithenensis]
MKNRLPQEESLLVLYFIIYSIIAGSVLSFTDLSPGWKLFSLTLFFHISFLSLTKPLRWHIPFQIWKFLLPLSILMILPDWFLSEVLGVLVFPEDGFFKIGTVAGYMAGLWEIPLFILVYIGIKLEEKSVSILGTCLWVAFLSLAIFGAAEATMWILTSWYAQNVKMIGHVALYVLVPEMILGVTTYLAYQGFSGGPYIIQIGMAALIMIQYTGSLAISYLVIEKIF